MTTNTSTTKAVKAKPKADKLPPLTTGKPAKSRPERVKADALSVKSEAAPPVVKPKMPKPQKKEPGIKKPKLVRDSFTIPESDYALFKNLKGRCLNTGIEVKKSELLRVALNVLSAMDDTSLVAAVNRLERLKTGRPAKKK